MEATKERVRANVHEREAHELEIDKNMVDLYAAKPSRLRLALAILGTLVIAAFAVMFLMKAWGASKESAPEQTPSEAVVSPNSVTIDESQLTSIKIQPAELRGFTAEKSATGKIAFNEDFVTPVFSPFAGRVESLLAKPGDVVHKGDPLFMIDTPDLGQAETDLLAAASSVVKAKASLELANRTEERQHRLYLNKAVALKDWEQSQTDVTGAQSDLRSAQAAEEAARDRLKVFGKNDTQIASLESTRAIDRVTSVRAPISGTVVARKVGQGQYVKTDNPDPLFSIANLSTMWMLADVYEADAPLIRTGQPVEVHVLALPGQTFHARVAYISPSVDPNTRRISVRCVVDNRGNILKPDMFASFEIQTSGVTQSVGVPDSAIVRDGGRTTVWVSRDKNNFICKEVTTGLTQDGYVQITSGVNPGDKVVCDGSLFLSNLASS